METTPQSRTLSSPPSAVLDPSTGAPIEGSFRGSLPPLDARGARGLVKRIQHEKAWYYFAIAAPDAFVGVAIAKFGYASSCFGFLMGRGVAQGPIGAFLTDESVLGPPWQTKWDWENGASFRLLKDEARFVREGDAFLIDVNLGHLTVQARAELPASREPLSSIRAFEGGLFNGTEKQVLLPVTGECAAHGKRYSLDGGFAGFDRTHGLLPRHTAWRWAFGMGRTTAGQPIAFNLVEGFMGEAECGVWVGDKLFPVGEGQMSFDADRPLRPWRVRSRCGAVDLELEPGDIHSEFKNLKLAVTRFIQPVGGYTGTLRVGGQEHRVERMWGVAEDQDALW